jgi:hypothetical protein
MTSILLAVLVASVAAFGLALFSAVAGFGGGGSAAAGVHRPVRTARCRADAHADRNGSRVWLNRRELRWSLIGWFALGAVPFAVIGGLLLTHAPLTPLKRLLGVFLIGVVIWHRRQRQPCKPSDPAFAAVGAA